MRDSGILSSYLRWIFVFVLATLYEFAALVLFAYESWSPATTITRAWPNLTAAGIVGAASGVAYIILLIVFANRSGFLLPAVAAALAAFLSGPAGYHAYSLLGSQPDWIRFIASSGIALMVYVTVFLVMRKIMKTILLRGSIPLMIVLLPFLAITAVPIYRWSIPRDPASNAARHVILISIDTLRHDYVSAYDPRNVQTPAIDAVAQGGVRFEVAISSVPQTGPSHISMLTGLSPLDHGVHLNGEKLPPKARTIAHQFRDAGFKTAAFVSGYPLKNYNCNLAGGFNIYEDTMAVNDRFRDVFYGRLAGSLPFFQFGVYRQAYEVTEPALRWLEKNSKEPFFLFLHYYDPHYPYGIKAQRRNAKRPMWVQIPKSDVNNQKRLYADEVRAVDMQIGRIVETLKERGIYDQTLLIVTSDHGESLGEHDFYYSHERFVYEQIIRSPLIIRYPLAVRPRTVFNKQVALLDVYKTMASAAAIPALPGKRGVDLIGLLKQSPEKYDRVISSFHFRYGVEGVRTESWKLIHNSKAKRKARKFELYNLAADPEEVMNRFETEQKIAGELMSHMSFAKNGDETDLTDEQKEVLRSLGYID